MRITIEFDGRIALRWIAAVAAGKPGSWHDFKARDGVAAIARLVPPAALSTVKGYIPPRGRAGIKCGGAVLVTDEVGYSLCALAVALRVRTPQEAIRRSACSAAKRFPYLLDRNSSDGPRAAEDLRHVLEETSALFAAYESARA